MQARTLLNFSILRRLARALSVRRMISWGTWRLEEWMSFGVIVTVTVISTTFLLSIKMKGGQRGKRHDDRLIDVS